MKWLGRRIRDAREQRGLSQEEFADLISRDQRAVSQYETGKRRIAVTDLPTFAQALGMPITYFFQDDLEPDDLDLALLREFHRLPNIEAKHDAIELVRVLSNSLERETRR